MKNTYPVHPLAAAFPEMSEEEFKDLKNSIQDHGLRHEIVLLDGQILDGRHRDAACLELKIPAIFRHYDPTRDGDLPVSFVADENLNRRNLTVSQRAAIAAELEPYFAEAIANRKKKVADAKAPKPAAQAVPAQKFTDAEVVEPTEQEFDKEDEEDVHPGEQPVDQPGDIDGTQAEQQPTPPTDEPAVETPETGKTAAAAAAEVTGVSERSVRDAKKLKEESPEEFQNVKEGEKTLNQAKQDAAALGESISPYRAECADMLEASHGEEFSQAIRNLTVLKQQKELEGFMKIAVLEQKKVVPFIVKGWKVEDAVKFLRGEFTAGTTVAELMAFANSKGETVEVEVGEFKITIAKK